MKIDITHEALLGALVDSVRDERDHGAALMRHLLRFIAEVTKQDWFETHWRTGARLELVQLACGDMPKHWGSSAPALDVIAEAARWGLKIEQVDGERRAALMAVTRLVGAEASEPSRTSAGTVRTKRARWVKGIAAKTKAVSVAKQATAAATRKAKRAAPARSTKAVKTPAAKTVAASATRKATAARKANGAAPARSTKAVKTTAAKTMAASATRKATAARKANGVAPARSTKAVRTAAAKTMAASASRKATAARKTNGPATARTIKVTASKRKAVRATTKTAASKGNGLAPISSAKAVKTAMPKARASATKKPASAKAKAAPTRTVAKATVKTQQRPPLARAAEMQAKSASSSANGAAPAPSFTGATDPA